jgi:hypothetical protein
VRLEKLTASAQRRRLLGKKMHGIFGSNGELQVDIDQTINEDNRWYGAHVQSGKELQAYIFLRNKKMKPYWPGYQQDVRFARHRAGVKWRSVLQGYLFIPVPADKTIDCYLIEQAPGVLKVMRTAENHVAELTVEEIALVRKVEEVLNAPPIVAVQGNPFKVGQRVRIVGMALEGTDRANRAQAPDRGRDYDAWPRHPHHSVS